MNNDSQPLAPRSDYPLLSPMEPEMPAASPFQLRKFLGCLRKFWWIPVLTLVGALGGAALYIREQPPMYVSRASLWETMKMRLPEGAMFSEDNESFLGTQSELLRSATLRDLALTRLQSLSSNSLPLGQDGRPLGVQVSVAEAPKSSVFDVDASGSNPEYVQQYLDALLHEYLQFNKDTLKKVSGDMLASVSEMVFRLERELKTAQDALDTFQQTNNIAILDEQGRTAGGHLEKLDTDLSDYQLQLRMSEATALENSPNVPMATLHLASTNSVTTLATAVPDSNAPAAPAPTAAPGDSGARSPVEEIALLKLQRDNLGKYLKPKHPKIVALDAQIERSQKLLDLYANQTREQLANERHALELRIAGVQESIKEWDQKVVTANALIAEADRLKADVSRAQVLYDRWVGLLQNVDVSRNIDQDTLAVLEQPSVPRRSYKQETQKLSLAAFAGILAGLGVVFIIAVRDDRFASAADISQKYGDVIVGQVPELPGIRGEAIVPLLEIEDSREMYAESYRNLRSAILFLAADGTRPKTLLVTSAVPDEGKSTIAANLARVLALGGARVVLVDADLRRGLLHHLMGLKREPGLAELLRAPGSLDQVIQTNSLPNLSFISRGGHLSNPGDVFLGPAMDEILSRLREQFDFVIVDTSPVFAADDATSLAPKLDGTIFVVRSRYSRDSQVREALELLFRRQARVLGVVLNRADASAASYYYYKHSDYHRQLNTA